MRDDGLRRVGLRDGSTVTGYVMNAQSPYTEVLTADGRDIRNLISGDAVSLTDASP